MRHPRLTIRHLMILAPLSAGALLPLGCSSGPDPLEENAGSVLTTTEGQVLTDEMFLGKWDLDGEKTNEAQGAAGVDDVPSDVVKDVMGKGWRFERGGVLRTDQVVGSKPGTWRLEAPNTLVIIESDTAPEQRYTAQFRNGYLFLKSPTTRTYVFERDKFFGM